MNTFALIIFFATVALLAVDLIVYRVNTRHKPFAPEGVLQEVEWERGAQDRKWGEQNHPNVHPEAYWWGSPYVEARARADFWKAENARRVEKGTLSWDGILLEEVYEALSEEDPDLLTDELIQVAAVAVAWVEASDRAEVREADAIKAGA